MNCEQCLGSSPALGIFWHDSLRFLNFSAPALPNILFCTDTHFSFSTGTPSEIKSLRETRVNSRFLLFISSLKRSKKQNTKIFFSFPLFSTWTILLFFLLFIILILLITEFGKITVCELFAFTAILGTTPNFCKGTGGITSVCKIGEIVSAYGTLANTLQSCFNFSCTCWLQSPKSTTSNIPDPYQRKIWRQADSPCLYLQILHCS